MVGILKKETTQPHHDSSGFNRSQVLKNTELNAQLGAEGERVREQIRAQNRATADGEDDVPKKKFYPKTKAPSALKPESLDDQDEGFANVTEHLHGRGSTHGKDGDVGFNEKDLSEWDRQRGQTRKITEPNTPYMGTAADTEYYDDDPVPDDIDLSSAV